MRTRHATRARPSHLNRIYGEPAAYEPHGVQPGYVDPVTASGEVDQHVWNLPGTALVDGTLDKAKFVSEMRAPTLWAEDPLPTLPDPAFPPGSLVYWGTDGKLYRNVSGDGVEAWTAAIPAGDIAGQITSDQIMAGAITAGKIEAGAVTADALASEIILGDRLITTGLTGARVEIDDNGIRNIDANEKTVVNIPTNGTDPVSVVGEIEASSLTATGSSELRGATTIPGNAVVTLGTGIATPSSAPTIYSYLGTRSLSASPAYPGHGIFYDSSGYGGVATFLIGANPTTGNLLDMAYEYNASTGALVRTIRKTGTKTTATGTIGSTSHVSDTTDATSLASKSQVATPLTMPRDGTITKVSAYLAGYGGSCSVKMGLWSSTGGTLYSHSAAFTAAERTYSNGNDVRYEKDLSTPKFLTSGSSFLAGFCRTTTGQGYFWSKDDGTGKTTKFGSNYDDGAMTSVTTDSDSKPNIYVTYTYEVDSSEEGTTGRIVGVVRAGSYIWCLDANGVLFKYNQADADYLGKVDLSAYVTGTKANAGLFYDGTNLIICTATGVTGADQVKFVKANATTGAYVSAHSATGLAINGSTATVRGGYGGTYYYVVVNGVARQYDKTTYAYSANNDWGASADCASGIAYDGTQFRGWTSATPGTVWQYSNWTWTTESAVYWVCYSWYKSTVTTYETAVSPRATITLGRRRFLSVSTPAIPSGSGTIPDRVRVYLARNATDPGGANYDLQVTDALTARNLSTYNSAGAANPTSNSFPAGTAAEIKSTVAGWSLKGDGTVTLPDTGWQSVTYKNSWADYGIVNWPGARYRKDAMGYVHISGMVAGGTPSTTSAVFTLPAGYRPSSTYAAGLLFGSYSNSGAARIDVQPDGDVIVVVGSSGWTSLEGITFKAEQ